jgi:hypothetical protein
MAYIMALDQLEQLTHQQDKQHLKAIEREMLREIRTKKTKKSTKIII